MRLSAAAAPDTERAVSDSGRQSETITAGWIANKVRRLALRAWRRDFIRRRPKFAAPLNGSGGPGSSGGSGVVVAYNPYGAYCVPLNAVHRPAARAIMGGRIWEAGTLDYLGAHMGDGDVVHAGASFGDFLPFLSARAAPSAMVWAFEPNAENYRAAQLTCALGALGNIRLTQAGLGAAPGGATMVVKNNRGLDLGGASYIADAAVDDARTQDIAIVSLDAFIPKDRAVSIIQLDVEGFETPALAGALALIARTRPRILLETPPDDKWIAAHLSPLGYGHAGCVDDNHIFVAG